MSWVPRIYAAIRRDFLPSFTSLAASDSKTQPLSTTPQATNGQI